MSQLLIVGDSFAADWSLKFNSRHGWPNLLAEKYKVTNVAQAGCSEYKIYKQIKSNISNIYDLIIVAHTSPYRIPVEKHPIHSNNLLHQHSDFIYLDSKSSDIKCITEYFEKYFWLEHALFVHQCTLEKQLSILKNNNVLHITMHQWDNLVTFEKFINFESVFREHPGLINHLTPEGNKIIFNRIEQVINASNN